MWQEKLQPFLETGFVVAVGVVQEQHLDRVRLYRQWRRLDWPIHVDALNLLDHEAVPIPMGIDESGVVRFPRLKLEQLEDFLRLDTLRANFPRPALPHALEGDRLFLEGHVDAAIGAYRKAEGPRALFRLGVALRRRFESDARLPGDGQAAIDAWTRALQERPGQYIWRRRIQQYGPRLDKPYNMFGWIEQARREIRERGEEPVPLKNEPRGSELLGKGPTPTVQVVDPDPERKVPPDAKGLVDVESIVTPARVRPGHRVRVRLVFRVRGAHWNNEAEPLALFVSPPAPATLAEGVLSHPNAERAESGETRIVECELAIAADAEPGTFAVPAYALYNVCETRGGTCLYLRNDFEVRVEVDPSAPKIQ